MTKLMSVMRIEGVLVIWKYEKIKIFSHFQITLKFLEVSRTSKFLLKIRGVTII